MLFTLCLLSFVAPPPATGPLTPVDVEQAFLAPNLPGRLVWKITGDKLSGAPAYAIRDYTDRVRMSGRAALLSADQITVTLSLPQGAYDIEFPELKQRFGLIVLPTPAGAPDPFFCIDSALSWLVPQGPQRPGLIGALARSGIAMSRERLSWELIQPAPNRWDWEGRRGFDTLRAAYAERKVPVLEMFHTAPAWAGHVGKYPDDLVATAQAWRRIAAHWRPTWGGLELWNEPEISFGANLPGDQYSALAAAAAYGAAQHDAQLPLVAGVFSHYEQTFLDATAAGGMLDWASVMSFHTYERAPRMEPVVEKYRRWLAARGRESLPLWITECGRPWRRGPGRPPVDQDAESALDIAMKAVEARACGIARYFAFVYPYYNENQNNFGMMDAHATPLRAMAAYAQAARALAGKRYLGDLRCDDPQVKRARVFGDDRQVVAVIYTGRVDPQAAMKLPLPAVHIEGIDGRRLDSATMAVPDGLAYMELDRRQLDGQLDADTLAMRLTRAAAAPPPARQSPRPIVLRLQCDAKRLAATVEGYRVNVPAPADLPLVVRAFNLGKQPAELDLQMRFARSEARVTAAPQRTRIPACGFADLTWTVDVNRAFAAADRLGVRVTASGGGQSAAMAFDLLGEAPLDLALQRYARRHRLPAEDPARWKAAIARGGNTQITRTADGHGRFDFTFAPGDRWAYPQFALPGDVDLSRYQALALRVRCTRPATVRVFLWEGDRGAGYITSSSIAPADGKWHTAIVNFCDLTPSSTNAPDPNGRLDLEQVRRISLGLNSEAAENTLEFSDLHVVGAK